MSMPHPIFLKFWDSIFIKQLTAQLYPDFMQQDFVPDVGDIRHKWKFSLYIDCGW